MAKWCQIHKWKQLAGQLKKIFASALLLVIPFFLSGQLRENSGSSKSKADSISHDSVISQKKQSYSNSFYDSVYRKFGRHKISRLLYTLAFVPPRIATLPDSVQSIRSEVPYLKYSGKIIRHIHIKTLDPFGPTVLDTSAQPLTGIGKVADNIHFTTRKFVIRKNLLFKEGQKADPAVLADNERILRGMPAIDDVRILLSPTDQKEDSVDVTVIVKDVFSIGFDLITVTPNRSVFRLYDGNFLGLGDRLVNQFSFENHRAPFVMDEGVNYIVSNLGGTFIDGAANYFRDDNGNRNVGFQVQRTFFSNKTKWAGSGQYQYFRDVNEVNDSFKITSYFQDGNLWIGRAFLLKTQGEPMRVIISEAAYNRHYFSRPFISADSNKRYYNYFQLLSGFSISKNNYYLTDYVFELGKKENIPYGELFQLTFGPEFTDFYTRFYSGIEVGYGDFIKRVGYLSGRISFSGYFHGNSFEDAILKVRAWYLTYLFHTPDKRYKFRLYLITDYRSGFKFTYNNRDYSDINQYLQLNKTSEQNSFQGVESLTASLSTMIYTPWYFYGFKFALLEQIQGGFVAKKNSAIFATPFFPGVRTGFVVKNDNLIFPALVFSFFFYPTTPSGGSWLQFLLDVNTGIQLPDFNVTAPKEETLQN